MLEPSRRASSRRPGAEATKFLVLGAAKCGTTSLCDYLAQHHDVYVAPRKEPVFFEAEYERGLPYYWDTYYPSYGGEAAVGEGRTYNLYLPFVPARIRESLPAARLIALLRDPVMRAYSHWWHRRTSGQEERGFGPAVQADIRRIESGDRYDGPDGPARWRTGLIPGTASTRHTTYVEMGYYAEQLRRYYEIFDADQIRVHFYEDLVDDPLALTRDLWGFLGVDQDLSVVARPHNVARAAQRGRIGFSLASAARTLGVHAWMPTRLRRTLAKSLPTESVARPPLDPHLRRDLECHYAAHDADLRSLLSRSLPYASSVG